MIITGAWTALFAVLAVLGIGGPWTACAAFLLALLLAVTVVDPAVRRVGRLYDGLFLEGLGLRRGHRAADLPGPGQPQASGVTSDEDTGVMTIDDEYRELLKREGK